MSAAYGQPQPLTPLAGALRQPDDSLPADLDGYLDHLCKQWDKQEWQTNKIARYYVWSLAELFWRGQQLVFFNPDSYMFEQIPDDKLEDLYFINNIMLPFCEWIATSYASSNPKLIAYADGAWDKHLEGGVEAAQFWIDCQRERLWSFEDLQRETHLLMFRSLVFTRTWQDGDKVKSEAIDPLQVDVADRARNITTSPILFYHDIAWNFDMLDLYGLDKIPKGAREPYGKVMDGLAFKRQLEIALGNSGAPDAMSSYGGATIMGDPYNITDDLTCRHSQLYFDRRVYGNFIVKPGTVIEDKGKRFRIGSPVKLGEIYPDGLKLCKLNGKTVGKYNVNKGDEWDYCRYTVPATGMYGVGTENMVAQQEWFNEFGSIITSSAVYSSNGITAADTKKIKNGNMLNKPGVVLAFDDIMPGEDIKQSIVHFNTNGMDAVLLELPNFLKESMQFTSGANNIQASGMPEPGVGGKTATAVMNMKAVADSFSSMRLQLRAENLARRLEQGLKQFQKHGAYPQPFSRYGQTQVKYLRGFDIPGNIRVRVEEGSFTPETDQEKIQKAQLGVGMGVGTGQLPPETDRYIGGLLNLPEMTGRYKDWATKGQKRLDLIIQAAEMAEQMMTERGIDPEMGQEFIGQECANIGLSLIDPFDNHAMLIQFYKQDIPVSDFYDDLSPAVKNALVQVVAAHEAGGVAEMQKQMAQQVAAQAPAVEAEQEQAAQANAMQQESEAAGRDADDQKEQEAAQREDQRAAMDMEREERGRMIESEEAEREREYQAGEAEKQRAHEEKLARMQVSNRNKERSK